jgi:hypothetical protein
MRSGIRNHQKRSDDPRCKETGTFGVGDEDLEVNEDFEVDPKGDFFGDYEDYSPEEFGLAMVEDEDEENLTHNGDSDDDEADEGDEVAYEMSLEPDRLPNLTLSNFDESDKAEDIGDGGITQRANRLRGGAEVDLNKKPYIVKFSKGKAGAVYTNHDCTDGNTSYISQISHPENPFSPFSSKIEWEIAHWAKTRGPSSTAFTELMNIEGVSGITIYIPLEANFTVAVQVHERLDLSFKNMTELNEIIDKTLPGRPHFERHELVIGNEVCEVYFRDVIECIKALFNDPSFTPYLMLVPEKHYTDETKSKRMYHDMHTGRWWWSTQVRDFEPRLSNSPHA